MNKFDNREMSGLALSVGTATALETYIPPTKKVDRDIPKAPAELFNYSNFFINVTTMVRNFLSSLPDRGSNIGVSSINMARDAILDEMVTIISMVSVRSENRTKVVYYVSSLAPLVADRHLVKYLRLANTAKQKQLERVTTQITEALLRDNRITIRFKKGAPTLNGHGRRLLLTHTPYDLLTLTVSDRVDLLESHTGVVKSRNMWYTKYYPVPKIDMSVFPFIPKLLVLFGDRVLFRPNTIKFRKSIAEVAISNNWHHLTSLTKVQQDIDRSTIPNIKDLYRGLPAIPLR